MISLICLLLLSTVLPGAAVLTNENCNTTNDTLYIIVDSSSNSDLTFTRIKHFLHYFISKRDYSSETQIFIMEPFQRRIFNFSNFSSFQEISFHLEEFKISISLNESTEYKISLLKNAISFTNEILKIHNTAEEKKSIIIAWFSVCYENCKTTIRFFEKYISQRLARQVFLFLPSHIRDSRKLLDSLLENDRFIYILLVPHDNLGDNNVIAFDICNECPPGWIEYRIDNDKSKFNCYKIVISPFKLSWRDASKKCRILYSDLPIVENNEELQFLTTLINSVENCSSSRLSESCGVYVDLTKTIYGRNILELTNKRTFRLKKNVEANYNCFVLHRAMHLGEEHEWITEIKNFSFEFIDCENEETEIVLCQMTLDNKEFDASQYFYPGSQSLTKKMFLNKEFVLKNDSRMYSIAHTTISIEAEIQIEYKQLLFDCGDGLETIVYSKVCNDHYDCANARDETDCHYIYEPVCINPNANEFFPARQTYLPSNKCNLHQDCPDNSDEEGCDECMERRCSDGTCVPRHWFSRDGEECRIYNNSNENLFFYIIVESDFLPTKQEIVNCYELEDLRLKSQLYIHTETETWAPKCILLTGRSGQPMGCKDLSHLQDCANFSCPEEFLKCHQAYCIPLYLISNGINDCPHGEDEKDEIYSNYLSCPFVCNTDNIQCIHYIHVCDGVAHCPDGDDELNCNVTCPPGFKCFGSAIKAYNFSEIMEINSFSIFDIQTKYLNLNGLDLSGLNDVYILPNLVELHASNCNLQSLEFIFSECIKMKIVKLDLSYNKFINLDINDGKSSDFVILQYLNLTGNIYLSILNGDFKDTNLDLSNTKVTLLNIDYRYHNIELKYLNVSNTKMESLGTLYEQRSFDILDIRNTMLSENYTIYLLNKLTINLALYTDNSKYCCPQVIGKVTLKHVCHAPLDGISSCEDLIGNILQRSLLWLVVIFSIVGNILVLSFRFYYDRNILKKGYGVFVTNLGVADFFMGVYITIIVSVDIYFRERYVMYESYWRASILCRFSGFLSTLSSESSIFFVLLITLDRFLVIRFPFGEYKLSKLVIMFLVASSWVLGVLLASIPLIYPEWTIYSSNGMCLGLPLTTDRQQGWPYAVGIFIIFNCILFIAISFGQVLIFISMNNQRMTRDTISSSRREQEINIAKQLFIVASSNFLCWFPICVTGLLSINGQKMSPDTYAWFAIFVLPLNAALNPLIYTIPAIYTKWREAKSSNVSKSSI